MARWRPPRYKRHPEKQAKTRAKWENLGRETVGPCDYVLGFPNCSDIAFWYEENTRKVKK